MQYLCHFFMITRGNLTTVHHLRRQIIVVCINSKNKNPFKQTLIIQEKA